MLDFFVFVRLQLATVCARCPSAVANLGLRLAGQKGGSLTTLFAGTGGSPPLVERLQDAPCCVF